MAQKTKLRSDNFITQLNNSIDDGLKGSLPGWLYKQVTFQPDRVLRPDNNKLAAVYSLLLISVAVVLLSFSLQ
jgi:hypothetical protein